LERRTWLKMTFENQLIVNPLWRVLICYVKMIGGVSMWQLYVAWFWMLLVIVYIICGGESLMIAYIYKYWWWWGDFCLCEHMHCSWVICSCIHDWWWRILYPIEVSTMFLLHRRWRPWGVLVPHASREESRTLHAFE
jgi:hypothetical protein